ncbi:MAG: TraR/DksA family transcriptional regulator [Isosphaeraceae bacterium]|nr:TraR/DksA family transcriptional regulator [Isosphaeraceae bacterium]
MAKKDGLLRVQARLTARRDALRKALSGDMDAYREYAAMQVGDSVDAAVDTANDEISSQLVELESRELGKIENALERIARGVYGRCEFCGEKIAEARLNALPYTSTCIDCQRESERTGRGGLRESVDTRWSKIYDKTSADSDSDGDVNIADLELDLSESGR